VTGGAWTADRIPDQTGRTVIITGANRGLGLATAGRLARRGARVIMAVRDEAKGRRALAGLASAQPDARLELRLLDLADLDSVRAFSGGIHTDNVPVDVLINNAAVMSSSRALTAQGNELHFGTNHLGHFALTGLLLDVLEAGTDPRVVTVSPTLHRRDRLRLDDLAGAGGHSTRALYGRSKLANVLFGLELHRRLRAAGSPVRSLLAHPGYAPATHQAPGPTGLPGLLNRLGDRLLGQPDAETGALPQLYAAADPNAWCGQFLGPDGPFELKGQVTTVRPAPAANDPAVARRLWKLSEELTGVQYQLLPAT
jgi:NAD(P)-dependent dehydrogenase (short-subunit alcohol dehydrogenase family)